MADYRIVASVSMRGTLGEMFDASNQRKEHPPEIEAERVFAQRLLDNRQAVLMALAAATNGHLSKDQIDMTRRLVRLLRS